MHYLLKNDLNLNKEIKDLNQNCFKKIHIIGNPPFGRQSSLAIKFIKKSAEFCDSISFILPKSFKKDSLKKHFPLNLQSPRNWNILRLDAQQICYVSQQIQLCQSHMSM